MSRLPDLVVDSRLETNFRGPSTIHTYQEIDEAGHRYHRQQTWNWGQTLGHGSYGQVRLQKCVSEGEKHDSLRAVKVILKPSRSLPPVDLTRELEAIAKFSSSRYRPWFVQSFGWYENDESWFISMEYCRHGDLQKYLYAHSCLSLRDVQILAGQVLEGLNHMHEHDFAHRDLKPGNVLIKSMPPQHKWWVVLADFGISKRIDDSNGQSTFIKGTTLFMAPELRGYLDQPGKYMQSVNDLKGADMWAFGEILFQMLTGQPTFRSDRDLMWYCDGRQPYPSDRLPSALSQHGSNFVTGLMTPYPEHRMSSRSCMQHRWIQSAVIEEDLDMSWLRRTDALVAGSSQRQPQASARWSRLSIEDEAGTTQQETASGPATASHSTDNTLPQASAQWSRLSRKGKARTDKQDTKREPLVTMEPKLPPLKAIEAAPVEEAKNKDIWSFPANSSNSKKKKVEIAGNTPTKTSPRYSNPLSIRISFKNLIGLNNLTPEEPIVVKEKKEKKERTNESKVSNSQTLPQSKRSLSSPYVVTTDTDTAVHASLYPPQSVAMTPAKTLKCLPSGERNIMENMIISPDGLRLALAFNSGLIQMWDIRKWKLLQTLKHHTGHLHDMTFSKNSRQLVSVCNGGKVAVWDLVSGTLRHNFKIPEQARQYLTQLNLAKLSQGGALVAALSDDQGLQVLNTLSGEQQAFERCKEVLIDYVTFPSNGLLVAFSGQHTMWVWDTETTRLRWKAGSTNQSIKSARFSPDGKFVVLRLHRHAQEKLWDFWELWDVKNQKQIRRLGNTSEFHHFDFTPDSTQLFAHLGDLVIQFWDVRSGTLLQRLSVVGQIREWDELHIRHITAVIFSPDGRRLAVSLPGSRSNFSHNGNFVQVWDARSGKMMHYLECVKSTQTYFATVLAFSPDGGSLVSTRAQGNEIDVWATGTDA